MWPTDEVIQHAVQGAEDCGGLIAIKIVYHDEMAADQERAHGHLVRLRVGADDDFLPGPRSRCLGDLDRELMNLSQGAGVEFAWWAVFCVGIGS